MADGLHPAIRYLNEATGKKKNVLLVEAATWSSTPASLRYAWRRCNANGRLCTAGDRSDDGDVQRHGRRHRPRDARRRHRRQADRAQPQRGRRPRDAGTGRERRPAVAGTLQQGSRLTATPGRGPGAARSPTPTSGTAATRTAPTAARCTARRRGGTRSSQRRRQDDRADRARDRLDGTTPAYASLAGLVAAKGADARGDRPADARPAPQPPARPSRSPRAPGRAPAHDLHVCLAALQRERRHCTPIAGATAASYTLTADDAGHTIVATVTATAGTAAQAVLTVASPASPS